ncbi:MAG: 16S rRNA (guanine(527)-N(7))-methyltransferase RsmG, partial [Coriobacteriaceae bacterium]
AELCGMDAVSRETIELPHDMGHRELLVYTRERNPQIKLPRRPGMAQHHPLMRK